MIRHPALFVGAVVLLTAACGGDKTPNRAIPSAYMTMAGSAATEQASPLPISQPSATPLIAGSEVRLCRGEDVATSASPNGAGGSLFVSITLANRADTACRISRVPTIRLLDAQGNAIPIPVTLGKDKSCCVFQEPLLLVPGLPHPAFGVPPERGQVVVTLNWSYMDRNGADCPTQTPRATQVELLLQDTQSKVLVDVTSDHLYRMAPCLGDVEISSYGPP